MANSANSQNPMKLSQSYMGNQGWVEILMLTLVYSKRVSVRNNLLHSVYCAASCDHHEKKSFDHTILFTMP